MWLLAVETVARCWYHLELAPSARVAVSACAPGQLLPLPVVTWLLALPLQALLVAAALSPSLPVPAALVPVVLLPSPLVRPLAELVVPWPLQWARAVWVLVVMSLSLRAPPQSGTSSTGASGPIVSSLVLRLAARVVMWWLLWAWHLRRGRRPADACW